MLGHVAFVLAMVVVIVLARLMSDRLNVPYTIVLTLCGLVYAVLPGPNLVLEPQLVLELLIPPLLYGAALRSSLLAIRANWRPITSLSVVLVLITAFAVGGCGVLGRTEDHARHRESCSALRSHRRTRSPPCRSAGGPDCHRG